MKQPLPIFLVIAALFGCSAAPEAPVEIDADFDASGPYDASGDADDAAEDAGRPDDDADLGPDLRDATSNDADSGSDAAPSKRCPTDFDLVVSGAGDETGAVVAALPDGGALFGGGFQGGLEINARKAADADSGAFLVHLDALGEPIATNVLGAGGLASITSLTVSSDGAIWVAGTHQAGADLGLLAPPTAAGAFVIKLDDNFTATASILIDGASGPVQVAPAPDGGVFLAGGHATDVTIGDTLLSHRTSATCGSTFVARLSADGTAAWARSHGDALRTLSSTADGAEFLLVMHRYCELVNAGAFVLSDSDGEYVSGRLSGDPRSGVILGAGGYVVGGQYLIKVYDSAEIERSSIDLTQGVAIPKAMVSLGGGVFAVTGGFARAPIESGDIGVSHSETDGPDSFLAVLDIDGILSFADSIPGSGWDEGQSVARDANGSLLFGTLTSSDLLLSHGRHESRGRDALLSRRCFD